MMQHCAVFLINLDDSPDRLKAATFALEAQGCDFVRVPGVDGRGADPATVSGYDPEAAQHYFGRELNGGEVGAFQSHLRALATFVESGAQYGLILEDDMDPDAHAMAFVNGIIAWQTGRWRDDWHVANLGAKRQKITSPVVTLEAGQTELEVRRAHYFPMLATALLWTRGGAQAFLDQHCVIDCPWDHATRRWLTASDTGLTVFPPIFLTTGADSQIDPTKGPRGAQGRTPLYRLRRMRRNWGDRLRAMRHKARYRSDT